MSESLVKWLHEHGLGEYAKAFVDGDVTLSELPLLKEKDLREMRLPVGARRRFLAAVEQGVQHRESPAPATDVPTVNTGGEPERRQLTVMFCDLVGSTSLSERYDPEDLGDIVRIYQDACAGIISRFEGYVARYMGDGMLVYFGYPRAHEDDAERAVRAGLAILERVGDLHPRKGLTLQTRIGVATGLVVVGERIGEASSQEHVVLGETPNLAARLQSIAAPNQIIVSSATRRLTGELFEFSDLGDVTLKGFASLQSAWRVECERHSESRFEAHRASWQLPLIGREQELELLLERWRRTTAGEGQMVLLSGEAGIGKSRIAQELLDVISDQPHFRIRYQCSPYHGDSPLYPAIEHLRQAASITSDDSNDESLDKLESMVSATGGDHENAVPLLAAMLGLQTETRYGKSDLPPPRQRTETLAALVGQLLALSREHPVLWVIEDMHWIDPTTLELTEVSLDATSANRIMILATARPGFEHGFGGHPIVTRLTLNRLGRRQVDEIATRICHGKRLPSVLLNEIGERTDGVPLFVEELTKTVMESSYLRETEDSFELTGEIDRLDIPSSLHDSLTARLDRLQPLLKEVAQIAACIGRSFELSLLNQVSSLEPAELASALEGLTRSELIFRRGTGTTYVFKHALVCDAAYESLLNTKRRGLHADILSSLEDDADTPPEILAHHASRAGRVREAVRYWKQAGVQALSRPAYQEAIGHFRNAVKLTAELDDRDWAHEQELQLQIQISQACIAHKGWAGNDTDRAFERALELVDLLDETPLRLPAIYGKFAVAYVRGEESRTLARRFQAATASNEDSGVELVAWRVSILQHVRDGDFSRALELAQKSVQHYDPQRHRALAYTYSHDARVAALVYGSWALWHLGFPDQARASRTEAMRWAGEIDHPSTTGLAQCWGGAFGGALERNVDQVAEHARKSIDLAQMLEMPLWLGWSRVFLGWAQSLRGERDAGRQEIDRGISELRRNRCMLLMPLLLGLSAEAHARENELALAHRDIDEAFEVLEKTGYVAWTPHLHLIRGELLRLEGSPAHERAEMALRKARDLASAQKLRTLELRAATVLGEMWVRDGHAHRAVSMLLPLYESFTEGFDTPDLVNAKTLLDELS